MPRQRNCGQAARAVKLPPSRDALGNGRHNLTEASDSLHPTSNWTKSLVGRRPVQPLARPPAKTFESIKLEESKTRAFQNKREMH